jgi:hypothetical protein
MGSTASEQARKSARLEIFFTAFDSPGPLSDQIASLLGAITL